MRIHEKLISYVKLDHTLHPIPQKGEYKVCVVTAITNIVL